MQRWSVSATYALPIESIFTLLGQESYLDVSITGEFGSYIHVTDPLSKAIIIKTEVRNNEI